MLLIYAENICHTPLNQRVPRAFMQKQLIQQKNRTLKTRLLLIRTENIRHTPLNQLVPRAIMCRQTKYFTVLQVTFLQFVYGIICRTRRECHIS